MVKRRSAMELFTMSTARWPRLIVTFAFSLLLILGTGHSTPLEVRVSRLRARGNAEPLQYVYRGDTRSPSQIAEVGGFWKPIVDYGENELLFSMQNHVDGEKFHDSPVSAYVSTSASFGVAAIFTEGVWYVYEIRGTPNMVSATQFLDENVPEAEEQEYAAAPGIHMEQVTGWWELKYPLDQIPDWIKHYDCNTAKDIEPGELGLKFTPNPLYNSAKYADSTTYPGPNEDVRWLAGFYEEGTGKWEDPRWAPYKGQSLMAAFKNFMNKWGTLVGWDGQFPLPIQTFRALPQIDLNNNVDHEPPRQGTSRFRDSHGIVKGSSDSGKDLTAKTPTKAPAKSKESRQLEKSNEGGQFEISHGEKSNESGQLGISNESEPVERPPAFRSLKGDEKTLREALEDVNANKEWWIQWAKQMLADLKDGEEAPPATGVEAEPPANSNDSEYVPSVWNEAELNTALRDLAANKEQLIELVEQMLTGFKQDGEEAAPAAEMEWEPDLGPSAAQRPKTGEVKEQGHTQKSSSEAVLAAPKVVFYGDHLWPAEAKRQGGFLTPADTLKFTGWQVPPTAYTIRTFLDSHKPSLHPESFFAEAHHTFGAAAEEAVAKAAKYGGQFDPVVYMVHGTPNMVPVEGKVAVAGGIVWPQVIAWTQVPSSYA